MEYLLEQRLAKRFGTDFDRLKTETAEYEMCSSQCVSPIWKNICNFLELDEENTPPELHLGLNAYEFELLYSELLQEDINLDRDYGGGVTMRPGITLSKKPTVAMTNKGVESIQHKTGLTPKLAFEVLLAHELGHAGLFFKSKIFDKIYCDLNNLANKLVVMQGLPKIQKSAELLIVDAYIEGLVFAIQEFACTNRGLEGRKIVTEHLNSVYAKQLEPNFREITQQVAYKTYVLNRDSTNFLSLLKKSLSNAGQILNYLNMHISLNVNISEQLAPSRNTPCTCGSGKKFKKCCGS